MPEDAGLLPALRAAFSGDFVRAVSVSWITKQRSHLLGLNQRERAVEDRHAMGQITGMLILLTGVVGLTVTLPLVSVANHLPNVPGTALVAVASAIGVLPATSGLAWHIAASASGRYRPTTIARHPERAPSVRIAALFLSALVGISVALAPA